VEVREALEEDAEELDQASWSSAAGWMLSGACAM
jgi:hypothetical protein